MIKNSLYQKLKNKTEMMLRKVSPKEKPLFGDFIGSSSGGGLTGGSFCYVPINASETCNTLAQIEGDGSYTQENAPRFTAAAGRYQFTGKTAVFVLKSMGRASTNEEATALWTKCRTSTSPECKSLQDSMCSWYQQYQQDLLTKAGIPYTTRNMYLAWNMGIAGAQMILNAANNGCRNVTDPVVSSNMQKQAWKATTNSCEFLKGMENYMQRQGVTV